MRNIPFIMHIETVMPDYNSLCQAFFSRINSNLFDYIKIYFRINITASMYIAGESFLNLPQIMFIST